MRAKTRACLAAMVALALTACGGGSSPPTVVTAAADSATVDWNTASTVDVLANDSASKGTLTLSAVSAPAHGKASIAGTAIQYTPDAGYFGTDNLSYTVQADDGTTATATLGLTVTAKLTVSGIASDGPLPNAAVTATVGTQTFKATADPTGKYSIAIATSTPADVITITAVGTGTQSQVKLRSILGDALAVSKLVTTSGALGPDQLASTNVNQISTVLAAMVEEANGGKTPTTLVQLGALTTAASIERLTDAAVGISLISQGLAALPAGVSDTMALVAQPSTSVTLSEFLSDQEANDNQFSSAWTALWQMGSVPNALSAVTSVAGHTLEYAYAYQKAVSFSFQVEYANDGTAQLRLPDGLHAAKWSQANGVLTLTLAAPDVSNSYATDPATGQPEAALAQTTGFEVSQIAGTTSGGIAMVQMLGSWTLQDGPSKGTVVPYAGALTANIQSVTDLSAVTPLSADDIAVGSTWGGILVGPDTAGVASQEDVLTITGPGTGNFARSGAATWSLSNGLLKVVNAGFEYDYQRMIAASPTGEEQWFVTVVSGGAVTDIGIQMVAKVATGLKFSDAASLAERWQSGFAINEFYDLYSNASGQQFTGYPDIPPISTPLTWSLNKDGTVTIVKNSNGSLSQREWTLLGKQSNSIFVMEHLDMSDAWQMNIYTDLGVAPVSSMPAPVAQAPVTAVPWLGSLPPAGSGSPAPGTHG